jgi:hypothetical protein
MLVTIPIHWSISNIGDNLPFPSLAFLGELDAARV